jgi:ribosomal-protein-alanine N-acetyltransferase
MSNENGMKRWIPDQVYPDLETAIEVLEFLMNQYSEKLRPDLFPFVLGVELQKTGELIGHVGLSPVEKKAVEIGYAIEEKHQGKGFATEAVEAISDWALEKLSIPEILGIVDIENASSCSVLEKAGYKFRKEIEKLSFGRVMKCKLYSFPSK